MTSTSPVDAGEARGRRWLIITVGAYLVALLALMATGHFAFISKELLLPLLFVPPALSSRLRAFWNDWAPFLGLILLYDALRGLVYAAITAFGLPVYMGYAIAGDRLLMGGRTGPVWLQQAMYGRFDLLDPLLTAVHASHFFVFFAFGATVWFWRHSRFAAFERGMLGVLYAGLVGYLVVPTVPPWMADTGFGLLPAIARPFMDTYNAVVPNFVSQFDLNPIAAMPSLHCAIPTFMAIFAVRTFGLRGWPICVYASGVFIGVVYGGEHYVVDVLAGVALGAAAYGWTAFRPPARSLGGTEPGMRTALFVVCVASSMLIGAASESIRGPWLPNDTFIARELVKGSPNERYLRARNAVGRREYAQALLMLEALPPSHAFDAPARLRVEAMLGLGRPDRALALLEAATPSPATAPEHLHWTTLASARLGQLDAEGFERALRRLEADVAHGGPRWARRLIEASRQDARP